MGERALVPGMLNLSTLEEHCMSEIENGCFRDPAEAPYSLELLLRAVSQDNQEAREAWQRCFSATLRGWLCRHPQAKAAYHFDCERHYLARTFQYFWQAVDDRQLKEIDQLATALRCLLACLNAVLLETFRTHRLSGGIPALEPDKTEALLREGSMDAHQLWERLQRLFSDAREQRVAYLLFHCHLCPEEILCHAPQEFKDVQEIYHLRLQIFERILLHNKQGDAKVP